MAFTTAEKLNRQGMPNHAATVIQDAIEGVAGDVSNAIAETPILADGSVNGRPLEARLAESANLLDFYQPTDPSMSAAMNRAIATGKPIDIPYSSTPYELTSTHALPSGAVVNGKGNPTLVANGASQLVFTVTSQTGVTIQGITINGYKDVNPHGSGNRVIGATGSTRVLVRDVRYYNARQGIQFDGGTVDSAILDCFAEDIDGHGVIVRGTDATSRNIVRGLSVEDCLFGVLVTDQANRTEISGCHTKNNGIELVAVTFQSSLNRIENNHAEGCGDNGISITGLMNVVNGNTCYKNAHGGIALYGGLNACTGNVCMSNGQRFLVDAFIGDGITIHYGWGGLAYANTVTGNICGDDQAVKTQRAGINQTANVYTQWAQGQTINAANSSRYRYYGQHLYYATTSGVTGATAPVHTSGAVSDGVVTWQYLWTADPAHGASRNSIKGNIVFDTPGNKFANRLYSIYKQTTNPGANENLPAGWTTATRPAAADYAGMIGFNSTTGLIEWSNGSAWISPSVP